MNETNNRDSKIGLAIGGFSMLGLGAGFFFFPEGVFGFTSLFAFLGCIIIGSGTGLIVAALLSKE